MGVDTGLSVLWACDEHEQIGPRVDMERHVAETGCTACRELSPETSDAIRDVWAKEGRDERGHHPKIDVHSLLWLAGRR